MVKDSCLYLFIGEDSFSKGAKLEAIKKGFLSKDIEAFNFDILYAKELKLTDLQERLLSLPLKAKKRIIVIKDAQDLKEDIKNFIITFVKSPHPQILLVLDINSASFKQKDRINRIKPTDEFLGRIVKFAQIYHFREPLRLDTFALNRQIDLKKTDYALRILNQLLKNGEKPERILGGLRYSCQRSIRSHFEIRKRIKLLLNCDFNIKTGRLRPDFALERLVVRLCSF